MGRFHVANEITLPVLSLIIPAPPGRKHCNYNAQATIPRSLPFMQMQIIILASRRGATRIDNLQLVKGAARTPSVPLYSYPRQQRELKVDSKKLFGMKISTF